MKKLFFLLTLCFGFVANSQIVNIPDANFKSRLLYASSSNIIAKDLNGNYFTVDSNNDGNIQVNEALQVSSLNFTQTANNGVQDLTGIQAFLNLTSLSFPNQSVGSLDLTGLNNLVSLWCDNNGMSYLYISGLPSLKYVTCRENYLSSILLTDLPNLEDLDLSNNQLITIDINQLPNLQSLNCYYNLLTSINVSNLPLLFSLNCYHNQLTSVNLTGLIDLDELNLGFNQLTTIDASELISLRNFNFSINPLVSVFMKNGSYELNIPSSFQNMPTLRYICADDNQIQVIQNYINSMGMTNCHVNSYCSFVPGGNFYTVQGTSNLDANLNGCDSSDQLLPNQKYMFNSNLGVSSTLFTNNENTYFINVGEGNYLIQPVLENPSYFTVSPTSYSVSFPSSPSPLIGNFCLTPNGIHNDLEITIIPTNPARPGFDAHYKLVYKNKGNQIQSGVVQLTYDDNILDFITSTPMFNSQNSNSLEWNFSNLLPFESREILLTLNLNTLTETPPVNNGDQLNFSGIINPLVGDDLPYDNTSSLKQTVVGSYDPNDKTCIEGNVVGTNVIGQYVHYVVRFENTGTANAENVVVRDVIDATKFDVSSLIPIGGSHEFSTRLINTNQFEFVFENIQLPYDDANNDGYVAFKIRTKSTLVVGNTFANNARIYFDYNFPIVTNTATTTIQALGNSDFEFNNYFTLSPVPTKDVLYFEANQSIEVSSISIYNTLGQLILVETNPSNQIDVSNLKTGNYFIKVTSDKGTSVGKFVKQ